MLCYMCIIIFVFGQAIEECKTKFDCEMLLQGKNLSTDEFDRLMKQHETEVNTLRNNFNKEKERQKNSVQLKVTLLYNSSCYMVLN